MAGRRSVRTLVVALFALLLSFLTSDVLTRAGGPTVITATTKPVIVTLNGGGEAIAAERYPVAAQGVSGGSREKEGGPLIGSSGAVIVVLALGTAVGLLLLIVFRPLRGVTRAVTRAFWCPFRDRDVTARFQEDAWDGTRLQVTQCTAFSPATAITCEKRCLHLAKTRAAA